MPGLFIDVKIDAEIAKDVEIAKRLEEVCTVDIFAATDGGVDIVEKNLDECVLCDLCLEVVPNGKLQVVKLYE
jgi:NAD-dependent dihydropyrimidine dehydrogenase PreA subunit